MKNIPVPNPIKTNGYSGALPEVGTLQDGEILVDPIRQKVFAPDFNGTPFEVGGIPDGSITADKIASNVKLLRSADVIIGLQNSINARFADVLVGGTSGNDDCTAAINAAISSLPSTGGRILLLSGTYTVAGKINITKPVTFEGQGAGTIINLTGSGSSGGFYISYNYSGTIGSMRNLKIVTSTPTAISFSIGGNFIVEGCFFDINGTARLLSSSSGYHITFTNNIIDCDGATGSTAHAGYIDFTGTNTNCVFENNTFLLAKNSTASVKLYSIVGTANLIQFRNNRYYFNQLGGSGSYYMYYFNPSSCKGLRITGESATSSVTISSFYLMDAGNSSTNWEMMITHNDWSGLVSAGMSSSPFGTLLSNNGSPTTMGIHSQKLIG
ncbi:MAG: glycoside hydrolase family 55 protein, partial [Tannerella sp.]|nr:glycoside hydrolase family 55 protein [Tannerella sp.]